MEKVSYPQTPMTRRRGNAFISAVLIMGILGILGMSFMRMGVNTKNIIRSSYVDQIASFIAEAAAREIEVQFREILNQPDGPGSIYDKVVNCKNPNGVEIPASEFGIPLTKKLLQESNIEKAGGGKFHLKAKVLFDGFDRRAEGVGGCYEAEKTGNFRILVETEFSKDPTGKIPASSKKWLLASSMDFKVVNIVSKSGVDKFRPLHTNDYAVWIRAAGLQNAIAFGQVMAPKQKLEIRTSHDKAKIFMGSGQGLEDDENSIKATNISNLDATPLFVNVRDSTHMPPPVNEKTEKLGGKAANKFYGELFDYENTNIPPQYYQPAYDKAKSKSTTFKKVSDSDADKAGKAAVGEAREGIRKFYQTANISVVTANRHFTTANSEDPSIISDFLVRGSFDTLNPLLKSQQNKHEKKTCSGENQELKAPEDKIDQLKSFLSNTVSENWEKISVGQRKFLATSMCHSRDPIVFSNFKDSNLEANFRARFFQGAALYWDCSSVNTETEAVTAEKWGKEPIRATVWLPFCDPQDPTGKKTILDPLASNLVSQSSQSAKGTGKAMTEFFATHRGFLSGRPASSRPLFSCFNTDYYWSFESGKATGDINKAVPGTPIKGEDGKPSSYVKAGQWKPFCAAGKGRLARYASYYFKNEEDFKNSIFYDEKNGFIRVKGVMVIKGGLTLPEGKDFTLVGRGILMSLGDLTIQGNLAAEAPGTDFIILFAKTLSGEATKHINILNGAQIRNISLVALSENFENENISSAATIRTKGQTLDIVGNYVADRAGWATGRSTKIDSPDDRIADVGNKIVYDSNLWASTDVYSCTIAGRYNEWNFDRID